MHLATSDLLLGRGHTAHLEVLRARSPRTHDGGQGHRAVLHLPHSIVLLLENSRSGEGTRVKDCFVLNAPFQRL